MTIFVRDQFSDSNRAGGDRCSICHVPLRAGEDRVIDTGVHIEFEGTFEFCESCFRDMARDLGYSGAKQVEHQQLALKYLTEEVMDLESLLEQKQATIDVLATELAAAGRALSGVDVPAPVELAEEPDFAG